MVVVAFATRKWVQQQGSIRINSLSKQGVLAINTKKTCYNAPSTTTQSLQLLFRSRSSHTGSGVSSLNNFMLLKAKQPQQSNAGCFTPNYINRNFQQQQYQQCRHYSFFEIKNEQEWLNDRIRDIQVHPDSIGNVILPGNLINRVREDKKTGKVKERKLPVELVHGYFWMFGDLQKVNNQPTLSNTKLIPTKSAQQFPTLTGLETLNKEIVHLPDFFMRKNHSKDEEAQCTLVAIAFRDFGYQLTKSWTEPFKEIFKREDRADVININITEGWFSKNFLKSLVGQSIRNNTNIEDHDNTLLLFGAGGVSGSNNIDRFRDSLRMHNTCTGYIFLLDGLGRIRFASSGEATKEEIQLLIHFANEITPLLSNDKKRQKRKRK